MGIFSNISDFFKSSNSLAKTSHQKHMENVEKSDIKVLEIQRKGTESTVVEVPTELNQQYLQKVNSIISRYPNDVTYFGSTRQEDIKQYDSLIRELGEIAQKALLWGIRDAQFYEELCLSESPKAQVSIAISEGLLVVHVSAGKFSFRSAYKEGNFGRDTHVLDEYALPFEDRGNYYRLVTTYGNLLGSSLLRVIWADYGLSISLEKVDINSFKGRYYIYHDKLGLLTSNKNGYAFDSTVGRTSWGAIIKRGNHYASQEQAKKVIDTSVKEYLANLKASTGVSYNVSDLSILSSGRAYSKLHGLGDM